MALIINTSTRLAKTKPNEDTKPKPLTIKGNSVWNIDEAVTKELWGEKSFKLSLTKKSDDSMMEGDLKITINLSEEELQFLKTAIK